ncbi:MAG: TetR/AcrR family transcriptional regulator [Pseudomonadota bacterium]|jgi:AcrR family transcriptional regulator
MRVKTDARRRAIIDAAWAVFKESGFERTTMSEISDRVGGSKATLYSYFKSKDDLFTAALEQVIRERSEEMFARLAGAGDLRTRLFEFASSYMEVRLSRDMIGVSRALMVEAERSDQGIKFWATFITPQWRRLADVFAEEMRAGHLKRSDAYFTALHFRSLIEVDIPERRLHGDVSLTSQEVAAAIEIGVEAFLRAYAPGD